MLRVADNNTGYPDTAFSIAVSSVQNNIVDQGFPKNVYYTRVAFMGPPEIRGGLIQQGGHDLAGNQFLPVLQIHSAIQDQRASMMNG